MERRDANRQMSTGDRKEKDLGQKKPLSGCHIEDFEASETESKPEQCLLGKGNVTFPFIFTIYSSSDVSSSFFPSEKLLDLQFLSHTSRTKRDP